MALITVVEFPAYLSQVGKSISEEESNELVEFLARHPYAGQEIPGTEIKNNAISASIKSRMQISEEKTMTAKKRNIGDEVIASMQEAVRHMQGKKTKAKVHKVMIPEHIDVKAVRKKLHLTRQDFADRYGFSVRTLQHWEQGNRQPHGPARVLLFLLECEPLIIEGILKKQKHI